MYTFFLLQVVTPKLFLQGLAGKPLIVKLKWGQEYKGRTTYVFVCCDSHHIRTVFIMVFIDFLPSPLLFIVEF